MAYLGLSGSPKDVRVRDISTVGGEKNGDEPAILNGSRAILCRFAA
jgi:hypothetical protein